MKRIFYCLMFLGLMACGEQAKIAYVDNVRLMDEFEEKVAIEADYNKKAEVIAKRRDSISRALQMEYQGLQTSLQGKSQNKIQEEMTLFQQKGQMISQQLQQEEQLLQQNTQVVLDSLVAKVRKEIKAYGKANGYTYILGGGEGGSVLYGVEQNDVTEAIITILNEGGSSE